MKRCLIVHCKASENLLWGPCDKKSGDKFYIHFTIYERQIQLSIIYLKDVRKKKRKTPFTFISDISVKQYSKSPAQLLQKALCEWWWEMEMRTRWGSMSLGGWFMGPPNSKHITKEQKVRGLLVVYGIKPSTNRKLFFNSAT